MIKLSEQNILERDDKESETREQITEVANSVTITEADIVHVGDAPLRGGPSMR